MDWNVKSLCGSEVTWKIKQLEVGGGRETCAPVPHSRRRQCRVLNRNRIDSTVFFNFAMPLNAFNVHRIKAKIN